MGRRWKRYPTAGPANQWGLTFGAGRLASMQRGQCDAMDPLPFRAPS